MGKTYFHLKNIKPTLKKSLTEKELIQSEKMVEILTDNGYKFIKLLGTGGYCVVGLFRKNKKNYAIKSYHKKNNKLLDKITKINKYLQKKSIKCGYKKKFLLDSKIMNINDDIYIASEPLDSDLFDLLFETKYKLSINDKLLIICQLSYALKCLHEIHIIHGDLKPENIFCKDKTQIKIGDFDGSGINNKREVSIYTRMYMHPNVNLDKINSYDIEYKDDIYSMALIFIMVLDKDISNILFHKNNQLSISDIIVIIKLIKKSKKIPHILKLIIINMLNGLTDMTHVYHQIQMICNKHKKTFKKYKKFKF